MGQQWTSRVYTWGIALWGLTTMGLAACDGSLGTLDPAAAAAPHEGAGRPESPSAPEPGASGDAGAGSAGTSQEGSTGGEPFPSPDGQPHPNGFFASATLEESNTLKLPSDGDLWPSCWGDDDALYATNGDGWNFDVGGKVFSDIAVARVTGTPFEGAVRGTPLAKGDQVGKIWNRGSHNRKPTGMVCVDGKIYLAVQDLSLDFDDAPAANISVSEDRGRTWRFETRAPMFPGGIFTTIWFADFGKNNQHAFDGYVYAYGLDRNWRDSFSNRVEDPTKMFLARVPKASVMDRSKWEFFTGFGPDGQPTWSLDIAQRRPVLEDRSMHYTAPLANNPHRNLTVLSQGSVTWNAPLERFIYTSWTEYTFDFYESPTPWGPWRKFLVKDYGAYPWTPQKYGGYATTIPSKYISADGKTMWVLSATFMGGVRDYGFSMRKLTVEPFVTSTPTNTKSPLPLTGRGTDAQPVGRTLHFGRRALLDDGVTAGQSEDSWNGEAKTQDHWGFVIPRAKRLNTFVYTTGQGFPDGGWFTDLRVEVRQNFDWVPVRGLLSSPAYPFDASAAGQKTYTFRFEETWGDAIRLIGTPGGPAKFTTVSEISAAYQ